MSDATAQYRRKACELADALEESSRWDAPSLISAALVDVATAARADERAKVVALVRAWYEQNDTYDNSLALLLDAILAEKP